jgi:phospholipase C
MNAPVDPPIVGQGLTRRTLLRRMGGLALAAAAQSFLPLSVQRALAQTPNRPGSFADIRHIVLLMQENRSFDHYFGTLAGVRGFGDPKPLMLPTGKSVFHQPDAENPLGYLLPFHLDTRSTAAQKIPTTDHSWYGQHLSWNKGHMDLWVSTHRERDGKNGPYCMGYFKRDDIPFHFALAETFTLCDHYFSSVMGPTSPNRMYWMTGTLDADGKDGGPMMNNEAPPGGFTWKTYAERLEEAGISWNVYQQKDNYDCNMLENFRSFQGAAKGSSLYERGMRRGGDDQFEYDAKNDKLPAVSWIIPASHESEHPDFTPADGAAFIARKIGALASNPDVWAKTLFVLSYDENDGIFDHVPPPWPRPGTPGEYVWRMPIGAGFRVPCILISPWTAGGWVCSDVFDHTSNLRLLEKFTGVKEANITDWRRQTFGDMTSALRFTDPKKDPPPLPDPDDRSIAEKLEAALRFLPAIPSAEQSMPEQEKDAQRK